MNIEGTNMRVVIEQYVKDNVPGASLELLNTALENEDFSDACCIGGIVGTSIYIRCPNSPHGVIADGTRLDDNTILRIVAMLKASVA